MGKKYPLYRSISNEYSVSRYAIRAGKDLCLYDDVGDYMAKHGARLDILVTKLIDNEFILSRYTDPSYPFRSF